MQTKEKAVEPKLAHPLLEMVGQAAFPVTQAKMKTDRLPANGNLKGGQKRYIWSPSIL